MARAGLVCMLHLGRSGSTVLGDLLGQNPYVLWDGEIYEPGRKLHRDGSDPLALLVQRTSQAKPGFYGFELKPFHARLVGRTIGDLVPAMRDAGVDHWIVLRRNNYLRKLASTAVARVTRQWHRHDARQQPQAADRPTPVRIDPQAHFIDAETQPITAFFAGYDRFFAELDGLVAGAPVLHLTYEGDIQADPLVAYRKACRFLDVAPMPVDLRYAPTTPFPLDQVIANLDEIGAALDGTPWAWMPREDAAPPVRADAATQPSTAAMSSGRSSASR